MYTSDEMEMRQKMADMRADVERGRASRKEGKEDEENRPPYWIMLLAMLNLRK